MRIDLTPEEDPDEPVIVWNSHSRNPRALVLLPWDGDPKGGTTVCHLDADGKLYGCRDVTNGHQHDNIIWAWMEGAKRDEVPIDDRRAKAKTGDAS